MLHAHPGRSHSASAPHRGTRLHGVFCANWRECGGIVYARCSVRNTEKAPKQLSDSSQLLALTIQNCKEKNYHPLLGLKTTPEISLCSCVCVCVCMSA